ncbi:hypothetical protein E2C01_077508 [Portunus trituberculatus]|uniref:Uncharacterized protein n=1 Tax=Portunus trituberculatus TaxID=210409 RepID=A0A5B7IG81_PORTR|nr:hypothetical protein [Portunus trituberculatus]
MLGPQLSPGPGVVAGGPELGSGRHQILSTEWTLHMDCGGFGATRLSISSPRVSTTGFRTLSPPFGIPKQLPRMPFFTEGAQQTSGFQQHQAHLDCTVLAPERVVSRSVEGVTRATPTPSASVGPLDSAPLPQVPPRSPWASADRVETVKRYVKYRGFSSKVAEFLAHDKRPSTLNYQHKWKRYRK